MYAIPLAIEESSVVAAAAKAANFWLERGGFKATVLSSTKIGHVHFIWDELNTYPVESNPLQLFFNSIKNKLISNCSEITANMVKRGGGILDIKLIDKTAEEPGYYQIEARFETMDSMGANFINSCLESFANTLQNEI